MEMLANQGCEVASLRNDFKGFSPVPLVDIEVAIDGKDTLVSARLCSGDKGSIRQIHRPVAVLLHKLSHPQLLLCRGSMKDQCLLLHILPEPSLQRPSSYPIKQIDGFGKCGPGGE